MSTPANPKAKRASADPGLCASCRHARTVETPRSVFWMCRLSATDPRFDKYPRLPVLRCLGYTPAGDPVDDEAAEL